MTQRPGLSAAYITLAQGIIAFRKSGKREACNRFEAKLKSFTSGESAEYWQVRTRAAEALVYSENVHSMKEYWKARALHAESLLRQDNVPMSGKDPLFVWYDVQKGKEKVEEAIDQLSHGNDRLEQNGRVLAEELKQFESGY